MAKRVRKATYISQLQHNLVDLQKELEKLIEERNDVKIKVIVAEQKQMRILERVKGWLTRVQHVETEAGRLLHQSHGEVEQLCLGGFCSINCKSSYKFGKQVANTLRDLKNLRDERNFEDVAQTAPEDAVIAVEERSIPSTVVGLESTLEKVWRCITEEQAGIIGIYGMGGVGKTTLLDLINNKFLKTPNNFEVVVWAVVSKDLELEKIKESIAKKIGLCNNPESWKSRSISEKAQEIFKLLSGKKFVLLLDDIWQGVSLSELGLPNPSKNGSKVIFTTRKLEVCGEMVAEKTFPVECLRYEDAWTLFEKNVQREILDSDPTIPELAKTVVNECDGLPLALIVVGRAMAFKKTPQEWEHAIQVLQHSAFNFSGITEKVFHPLKLSYNFLPNEKTRFCLLYCTLFPEDYKIKKEELIDCWICEEFLDDYGVIGSRNDGYDIIGTPLRAFLLEEEKDNCVKMHDVIRDMALWIPSTIEKEKEKEKFLVLAAVGLNQAPRIRMWEDVTRMSLMKNKMKNLSESPTCPRLQTLFLGENGLQTIESDFFQSMSSLYVLNLSRNYELQHLPPGISYLVSLQHLNLSYTTIKKLPEELNSLVNLKCLNLEFADSIRTISRQLISDLKMLRILRMFECGSRKQEEDSILFGGGERLIEELLCLEHLNVLTIDLKSSGALQRVFSYPILSSIIQSLGLKCLNDSESLSVLSLASLRRLEGLYLSHCDNLKEFKIDYPGELKIIQQSHGFHSLQEVDMYGCDKLRHMTFLIFAPNLKRIGIIACLKMEEIIKLDEIPTEVLENLISFPRLQFLQLWDLYNLKSISSNTFQFSQLKTMNIRHCPNLQKLPLDCSSGSEGNKFIIEGEEIWWNNLQWDNEATKNVFLPYFKSTWR